MLEQLAKEIEAAGFDVATKAASWFAVAHLGFVVSDEGPSASLPVGAIALAPAIEGEEINAVGKVWFGPALALEHHAFSGAWSYSDGPLELGHCLAHASHEECPVGVARPRHFYAEHTPVGIDGYSLFLAVGNDSSTWLMQAVDERLR